MKITSDDFARVRNINRLRACVMETPKPTEPLVPLDRQHDIRQFHIDLAQLQFKHGLQLVAGDDRTFEIIDARRDMPAGYSFSAIIREDGKLEIQDWVPEL